MSGREGEKNAGRDHGRHFSFVAISFSLVPVEAAVRHP